MIDILDHGYVKLNRVNGSEIDIVNAARVSFDKETDELSDKDTRLLNFLIEHKHNSPLRHVGLSLEFYAPLLVARQAWKHVIGISSIEDGTNWNESSRRYITENEEFYIPDHTQWRAAPENRKQGSAEPLGPELGFKYSQKLKKIIEISYDAYEDALRDGVAPEQARLLLPAYAMYVRWRWTATLESLLHFCDLRNKNDAQYEIQLYGKAVAHYVREQFPNVYDAWSKQKG